jgi:DNA polymerase I-like protein with 3'-5' exonuclease and polymerase domains
MDKVVIDFETYYDDELTVKRHGALNYLSQTNAYLVSLVGNNFEWVGNPLKFDWNRLSDCELWAHNFNFDGAYFLTRELPIPGKSFNCSANLAAWLGAPRALDKASRILLGTDGVSKDIRKAMKGRTWHSLSRAEQQAVTEYALTDSREAKKLIDAFASSWPLQEQELSRHTIRMGWEGIGIDSDKLARYLARAIELRTAAVPEIPWAFAGDGRPLSLPLARAQCARIGITPPSSFNQKDNSFLQWEAQYRNKVPFVAAVARYRKAALLQARLEAMGRRILPNGRMAYALKYFGSHTGRWAGGEGLNVQNFKKADFHGISERRLLVPAAGKKLLVIDLRQIEPRVLAWLCGDDEPLSLTRSGYSFYEAQAKAWNLWDGQKGTMKMSCRSLYDAIKRLSLGAGYGMGARRFQAVVLSEMGVAITLEEAKRQLSDYRRRNPKVVAYWEKWNREVQFSVGEGVLNIRLPSGRELHYRNLRRRGRDVYCTFATEDGYRESKLWGGFLTENIVQATARDVFAALLLRLEAAGLRVVLHCHDEFVLEVDHDVSRTEVEALLWLPPEWCPDLPIDVSSWEGACYVEA